MKPAITSCLRVSLLSVESSSLSVKVLGHTLVTMLSPGIGFTASIMAPPRPSMSSRRPGCPLFWTWTTGAPTLRAFASSCAKVSTMQAAAQCFRPCTLVRAWGVGRQFTQTLRLAVPIQSHTCAPIRVDYSRVLDGRPGPSRRQAPTFQLTSAHCCGSVVRSARAVTGHLYRRHLAPPRTPDSQRCLDLRSWVHQGSEPPAAYGCGRRGQARHSHCPSGP